jgi:acyl carrier protein
VTPPPTQPIPPPAARLRVNYAGIARGLRTPDAILSRVQAAQPKATNGGSAKFAPPRTELECALAALWRELLHAPAVGVHDNFFELGGHSLLAVQLLSRVRQAWGVDLSLEVVYSGEFTVAELAKAIELKEMEQSAGGQYEELLKELEGLSDEEVRALLAQEQEGGAS